MCLLSGKQKVLRSFLLAGISNRPSFDVKKAGKVTFGVFHSLSWDIGRGDGVENVILRS